VGGASSPVFSGTVGIQEPPRGRPEFALHNSSMPQKLRVASPARALYLVSMLKGLLEQPVRLLSLPRERAMVPPTPKLHR